MLTFFERHFPALAALLERMERSENSDALTFLDPLTLDVYDWDYRRYVEGAGDDPISEEAFDEYKRRMEILQDMENEFPDPGRQYIVGPDYQKHLKFRQWEISFLLATSEGAYGETGISRRSMDFLRLKTEVREGVAFYHQSPGSQFSLEQSSKASKSKGDSIFSGLRQSSGRGRRREDSIFSREDSIFSGLRQSSGRGRRREDSIFSREDSIFSGLRQSSGRGRRREDSIFSREDSIFSGLRQSSGRGRRRRR